MNDTVLEIIEQKTELVVGAGGGETVLEISEPPRVEILTVGIQGPPGIAGDASLIIGEIPTGALNGSNATFSSHFDFKPESVAVFMNGLMQKKIADFNTNGTRTIFFTESPGLNDSVLINYLRG